VGPWLRWRRRSHLLLDRISAVPKLALSLFHLMKIRNGTATIDKQATAFEEKYYVLEKSYEVEEMVCGC
jgi:hypothetical protein